MSDPHKIKYPPTGLPIVFDGGLNNKFQRALIGDNESPECQDVVFDAGAVETRQGVSHITAIASAVYDGLYTRHGNTGNETMVAFCNGSAWAFGTTTFVTIGSAQSVFTAGNRVAATEYENHMFIGNGGIIPYKYDGTEFTRHGVPAPSGTVVAAADSAAGNPNGSYIYVFTYVNSQAVESNYGASVATSVANKKIYITDIPVAPQSHGVNARNIYRTEAGSAAAAAKRVGQIADNTTTVYLDNIADGSLGVAVPTAGSKGEPPKYGVIKAHRNRLFCDDIANPNYIWYSDLGEPYTFGSTNFIYMGDLSGDLVRTIAVYDDSLVIGCDRNSYLIYMVDDTPGNWSPPIKIRSSYGCKSPFAPIYYNNKVLFPAMDDGKFVGFAAIQGPSAAPDATILTVAAVGSDQKSNRIEPDMFLVNETYIGNISGKVFKNKAYLAVSYGSGQTTNNRIYVYDFSISNLARKQEAAWVPFTGLTPAQFTEYNGDLYFGSSIADGALYKMFTGVYNDNGSAIDSYYWTKEFGGLPKHDTNQKDFRTLSILYENSGAWPMNVTARVDGDKGKGNAQQVDLNPGSSLWGTMDWGADTWGGGSEESRSNLNLGQSRGKRIQFKFDNQNTADQKFKVMNISFNYNLKGER